jgi:hypothetical protein
LDSSADTFGIGNLLPTFQFVHFLALNGVCPCSIKDLADGTNLLPPTGSVGGVDHGAASMQKSESGGSDFVCRYLVLANIVPDSPSISFPLRAKGE